MTYDGTLVKPGPVVCGLPLSDDPDQYPCDEPLFHTFRPAATLWCPVHGHVLEATVSPPLTGVVHLNYGGGRGEFVDLAELERSL